MDYSIVVELVESDQFFKKKKELLQLKGFATKELICIKDSSFNEICDTLKVLLQIERIMNLDEVDLYFSEGDAHAPVEFYSPRNEVEALNSTLSLVDMALSNCSLFQMNILRRLREAVVDMLSEFGKKNTVDSSILREGSCDKENSLLQWGESFGVRTHLLISYVEGAGRGLISKENMNVGDVALEIPLSIIISEETVHKSNMLDAVRLGCLGENHIHVGDICDVLFCILEMVDNVSSETMLLLWSMREKHDSHSTFKKFFDTLPETFNTGLSFGIDALMVLEGTLLFDEMIQAKQHLRQQYDELFPALCINHPDKFPAEICTWDNFLWACELWYSYSMKIMFPDGITRTCLVPIAGFLNHSLTPHISRYGKVDSKSNSLKFCLSRPCYAGEQCCLSYGRNSSAELINFYGFIPRGDNPYDVIPIEFDVDEDEFDDTYDRINHMVRGTWFSNNHSIFHYGLPSPLLDSLYKAQFSKLRVDSKLQGNLENEIEFLENLSLLFEGMMDKLEVSDEDRCSLQWDVKLAVEYKDIQRRIVNSVMASCDDGVKLVIKELMRAMDEDILG